MHRELVFSVVDGHRPWPGTDDNPTPEAATHENP
jgi:hypothetical protein